MIRNAAVLVSTAVLLLGCASVPALEPTSSPAQASAPATSTPPATQAPGQTEAPTAGPTAAPTEAPGETPGATPAGPSATLASPTPTPVETATPVASSAVCALTSADELGSVFGGSWIQTDAAVDSCGWTSADQLASLEVSYEQASDFSAAQILLSNPQQVTVAGHPAIIGDFLGPELYVQIQPNLQLLLQGILMDTTAEMHQKFIDLATTMIGRM
jgi:hypothetical protein